MPCGLSPKDPRRPPMFRFPSFTERPLRRECDGASRGRYPPNASASLMFRHPQSANYEILLSVFANSGHRQDSNSFEGLRALPVGQTGFLRIGLGQVAASGSPSPIRS